jgi:hypothetical protein
VLVKTVGDGPQADRLRRQIAKQRAARAANTLPYVRIPAILDEGEEDGRYAATMEYVYFQDPIEYFNGASTVDVARAAEMILGYVDMEFDRSVLTRVPVEVLTEKLDSVEKALTEQAVVDRYSGALDAARGTVRDLRVINVPVGPCHGDLTVANLLFAHDSSGIALVDFLDSFLESPLIDLAKLRQDTRFGWTVVMATNAVDQVRFRQIMDHLDRVIDERFGGHPWYGQYIDLLTSLCLLRIAPYARSSAVHRFLESALDTIRL